MLLWKGHIGEHVLLGTVHEICEFRHLPPDLVGDATPLCAGGLRRVLDEGGRDEGRDDAPPALPGMRQGIAREMYAAPLPGSGQTLETPASPNLGRGSNCALRANAFFSPSSAPVFVPTSSSISFSAAKPIVSQNELASALFSTSERRLIMSSVIDGLSIRLSLNNPTLPKKHW